jgi:2-polyprenyl-6-methoxyphenol hydroxylase-like FAD-dependent oxidoreductase
MSVVIVGAGVGGLTLALALHARGIHCRVHESVKTMKPLGVGINVLPHAMREFTELGIAEAIEAAGITTSAMSFYNRFGQHIYSEARGRAAGYEVPQVSIHRGKLQRILHDAVVERLGEQAVRFDQRLVFAEQTLDGVRTFFEGESGDTNVEQAEVLIGCDGIRSQVRQLICQDEDPLCYSGITMWRGVSRWPAFLDGSTMLYAGWLSTGKIIAYPIEAADSDGTQLINWLCEFFVPPRDPSGDWSQPGSYDDFLPKCEEMRFPFLDVPAMMRAAESVYEYPMVDRDPLPYWTDGRMTLLGDAAHPMYPRGSNGAGQAVVDARTLADCLASEGDPLVALHQYDDLRCDVTGRVVLANRANPPDAILREVFERTDDSPFDDIDEVIRPDELRAISDAYKRVAGFDKPRLSLVR